MPNIANPFRMHYQSVFREMASDSDRPLWDRLGMLAWGTVRANGHAHFQPGELAEFFGVPAKRISEALAKAKGKGMIDETSSTRCLVVPEHVAVRKGEGNPAEPCSVHHVARRIGPRKHAKRRVKLAEVIPMNATDTLMAVAEDFATAAPCSSVSGQPPAVGNSEVAMKVCSMTGCAATRWRFADYCRECLELERQRKEAERGDEIFTKRRVGL